MGNDPLVATQLIFIHKSKRDGEQSSVGGTEIPEGSVIAEEFCEKLRASG